MSNITKRLLKDRGGISRENYACPVHVSTDACKLLFEEAKVVPTPKAVGVLGDVLENYALLLLEKWKGKKITEQDIAQRVAEVMEE